MNIKNKIKSKNGFSLIELMVVVAIIGILVLIALPQYNRFTARARQKDAQSMLSGMYTALTATFQEFGQFSYIAYSGYNMSNANTPYQAGSRSIASSARNVINGLGPLTPALRMNCFRQAGPAAACTFGAPASNITRTTFDLGATGVICPGGLSDRWSIDENRALQNTVNGCQ